jgi:hypothetical protein
MGHIHIGTLPLTPPWKRVHFLLSKPIVDPSSIANAIEHAAHERLEMLKDDRSLIYCVWLLVRLASAAGRPDFNESLRQMGLDPRRSQSVVAFLSQLSARVRIELETHPESGPFGDLAARSMRRVLLQSMVTEQLALFDDGLSGIERSLRSHGTPTALGHLISRFFGDFLGSVLRFYVDKALPLQIGPQAGFTSITEGERFMASLSNYAATLATSTDVFANRWFTLHNWTSEGAISREEVAGFVAHAVEKLQNGMALTGTEASA